jgi:hypothetical protein
MKSWIILIVLAVAITSIGTVAWPFLMADSSAGHPNFPAPAAADDLAPVLEIEGSLTHLFGVMAQRTPGSHPWLVKNTGKGVLELRGSSTSCSCTTSDLFEEVKEVDGKKKIGREIKINPGESKKISLSWNTKTFNDHYRQFVKVATNDPLRPEIELVVEGTIKPAISTMPPDPSINFMNTSNDEPIARHFMIFSADRPDLKLTRLVSSNPDLIGIESKPLTPEERSTFKIEKGYSITVTLKPSPKLGEFNDEILIETDHPNMKEMKVPVKGKTTGPIISLPEKIVVRGATSSNGGSEVLTLLARGRKSVNFTVDKKPEGMEVSIEQLPDSPGMKGSLYKMLVKIIPGIDSGQMTGEVVLKTDDPKVSELRVPVDVLVQGAK